MLDYKLHFAVMVNEDRLRAARRRSEQKRVYRLGGARREGRR